MISEQPTGNDKLAELENKKHRIVRQAASTWELVYHLRQDVRTNIVGMNGSTQHSLTEDSYLFSEACGIPKIVADKWATAMISEVDGRIEENLRETSFKQYSDFLDDLPEKSPQEFGIRVGEALRGKDQLIPYFDLLMTINPLVGATVIILYDQATKGELVYQYADADSEITTFIPANEWYKKSVEQSAETSQHIETFFEDITEKVAHTSTDSDLTQQFLIDWKNDLQLNNAELLNSASCSAIHLGKEDCAVFISPLPMKVPRSQTVIDEVMALQGDGILEDGREPIYRKYTDYFFEHIEDYLDEGIILLPIFSTIIDTTAFISKYREFWKQVVNGLKAKKNKVENVEDGTGAYKVGLGRAAKILLRENQGINTNGVPSQARIGIQGEAAFSGFDIRIDKEMRRGITLDIGGVSYPQMLAYARSIAELDKSGECVMGYSRLIGKNGRLRGDRGFYPSVMESTATYIDEGTNQEKPLTLGNKMAIVAAVVIADGGHMGIRNHNFFSYHTRENVAQNTEYSDKFSTIVRQLKDAFTKV
ncbi:MAG TPA: hypothetical protein VM077_00650 [Candidatus Limnocylindrales bacterium]|nr:hypothetical protein [Candidatus Limnocylindrales bacterium]